MCKVSVVMPVWNSERYLTEALQSILDQTFTDFEILVLDDGSTDRSLEISHGFADRDPRVKVIANEHQGYSPLLNLGLSLARGRYIARMDSDDICMPDRFALQVAFLDSHPDYVAVGSQAIKIDPDSDPIGGTNFPLTHEEIDTSQINGQGKIMHPAATISRAALEKIGGYRPQFEPGEDFDLFLRLAEVGKLANLPEALLRYRMHMKNVTVSRKEHHQQVKQQALTEAYERRQLDPAKLPTISFNESPMDEAEFHFFWMEMALSSGFYQSARKNAWLGFKACPLTQRSLSRLAIGIGGPISMSARKIYQMSKPIGNSPKSQAIASS
jgi:glycosyltransferase involved in cell wall biosynthesis